MTVEGEWELENSTSILSTNADTTPVASNFDLRVLFGAEITLPHDATLTLTGEIGGIDRSAYNTYGGGANFSVPF